MSSDFVKNLTMVTGYGRSVADVCRRAGINRQQYNRYLSGRSTPSLSTIRRICDFFGLDDHELFLDHQAFTEIIRLRPPRLRREEDPIEKFVRGLARQSQDAAESMAKYEGYYHCYSQADADPRKLLRTLISIRNTGMGWVSKAIERYSKSTFSLPDKMKFSGVVFLIADRLILFDQETRSGNSTWVYIMYTTDFTDPNILSGLVAGIVPESSHEVVSYRIVWDFLGKRPDLRTAIRECDFLDIGDESIPPYISRYFEYQSPAEPTMITPRL